MQIINTLTIPVFGIFVVKTLTNQFSTLRMAFLEARYIMSNGLHTGNKKIKKIKS